MLHVVSVKIFMVHTAGTFELAGLLKTSLAVRHGITLPHLYLTPRIVFEDHGNILWMLKVDISNHSHHMDACGDQYPFTMLYFRTWASRVSVPTDDDFKTLHVEAAP